MIVLNRMNTRLIMLSKELHYVKNYQLSLNDETQIQSKEFVYWYAHHQSSGTR